MSLLRSAVLAAKQQFAHYATNHRAKIGTKFEPGTPGADETLLKAQINDQFVELMDKALAEQHTEDAHAQMVTKLQKSGEAILEKLTPLMAATIHMAMGAGSEAGELADAIKRWAIYGKDIDRTNVVEELGDIEFFLEGIRQNLEITREETLHANMLKLGVRYEGHNYSDEQAIGRRDKETGQ